MNEEFFGDKKGGLTESVRTFDAFPKTRASYTTRSSRGGIVTLLLITTCLWLAWHEMGSYFDGIEEQHFLVEKSIGHEMQINLDITVAMPCDALHINVQDAAADRILAGDLLQKDATAFDDTSAHRLVQIGRREEHVYDVLKKARKSKFGKTRWPKGGDRTSCRIYGSMDVNRVQGDFHITAKGHGYWDAGQHIEHDSFNFSHVVNELSFGEYYPKLINPLDGVVATTEDHFYKFQYYLSVVPTIYESYTTGRRLATNQYAVTEQSRAVPAHNVPGIFFKYDIEPISLTVTDSRTPVIQFIVRLVNIIGGVLVSGGWIYKLLGMAVSVLRRKKRDTEGMLNGRVKGDE
ncbi:endoplasmic reticulum vesicle transporter-domain-containing protein [Morchella snyderi]|nr:endoplasmic reticulum vesicle transporter-domain-containing protein [Morchella snyderi]